MSMIENLARVENQGIRKFVKIENERWACSGCGEIICVHRPNCLTCDTQRNVEQLNKADR